MWPNFEAWRIGRGPAETGQEGRGQTKVSRSLQILAMCLGLWIGLVLVLASSVGWQITLPVLVVGVGVALVFPSFLLFTS